MPIKSWLTAMGLCLLISFSFSLFASTKASHTDPVETLQLATLEYPPHYGSTLKNQGPLAEIVKRAFLRKGIKADIVFLPWSRALEWAKNGKVDGIMGAWFTEARTEHFIYSQPVYSNELVFYKAKNKHIVFKSFKDLVQDEILLGSVRGYAQIEGLEESGIYILYVNNDTQNFKLLSRERVDLVVVDREYAKYMLATPELKPIADSIELIDKVLEFRLQHVLISKQTPQAQAKLTAFNEGLAELKETGEFQQILDQHQLQVTGVNK